MGTLFSQLFPKQDTISQQMIEQNDFANFLPLVVDNLTIEQISWNNFQGIPEISSGFDAYCYWRIQYRFSQKKQQIKKISCYIESKSWTKVQQNWLLEHEIGHYMIGCVCALEFSMRLKQITNQRNINEDECQILFNEILVDYLEQEIKYDELTQHGWEMQNQKKWNQSIKQQILSFNA